MDHHTWTIIRIPDLLETGPASEFDYMDPSNGRGRLSLNGTPQNRISRSFVWAHAWKKGKHEANGKGFCFSFPPLEGRHPKGRFIFLWETQKGALKPLKSFSLRERRTLLFAGL